MKLTFLRAKLHRAAVTQADLNYEASISLSTDLIEASGLYINEKVDIYNITNGERFSTYVIKGRPGEVCLNGAAARLVQAGDKVIICSYVELNESEIHAHVPNVVLLGENNEVINSHHKEKAGREFPGLNRIL